MTPARLPPTAKIAPSPPTTEVEAIIVAAAEINTPAADSPTKADQMITLVTTPVEATGT